MLVAAAVAKQPPRSKFQDRRQIFTAEDILTNTQWLQLISGREIRYFLYTGSFSKDFFSQGAVN